MGLSRAGRPPQRRRLDVRRKLTIRAASARRSRPPAKRAPARHGRSVPGGKIANQECAAACPRGQSVLLRRLKIDPPQHVIECEQRRRAITACPVTPEDADLEASDGTTIACREVGGKVLFGGTI